MSRGTNTRRQFIKYAGVGSVIALAGCSGDDGDGGDGSGDDGSGDDGTSGDDGSGDDDGMGDDGSDDGGTTNGDDGPIQFGVLLPFTGELAAFGGFERRGVGTAIQVANEAGGIHGREVQAVVQGTSNTSQGAQQGLRTLDQAGVHVMYGSTSNTIASIVDGITEMGILATNSAGTTFLDDKGGGVDGFHNYRAVGSDSDMSRGRATFVQEQGWETVAVAHLDSTGSASAADIFTRAVETLDVEIVEEQVLPPNASSYRSELTSMQGANPDAFVVNIGADQAPLFITNYRELGIDIPMMVGNEALAGSVVEQVGSDALTGFYGLDPGSGPNFDQFAEIYQDVQDREVEPFSNAAFDGAMTCLLALQAADEISRDAVVDVVRDSTNEPGEKFFAFEEGKQMIEEGTDVDYEGAVSNCQYDQFGDAVPPLNMQQFQDGEWTRIKTYNQQNIAVSKEDLA